MPHANEGLVSRLAPLLTQTCIVIPAQDCLSIDS